MEEKILFTTMYGHDSVIHSLITYGPFKKIILFKDEESKEKQLNALEYIKSITKPINTEIKVYTLSLDNPEKIFSKLEEIIPKYKYYKLYFNLSQSRITQCQILMLYLIMKKLPNLEKIITFTSEENSLIEYPIIMSEKLNINERRVLSFIEKETKFTLKNVSDFIGISQSQVKRILDNLIIKKYIEKIQERSYILSSKARLYKIINQNKFI